MGSLPQPHELHSRIFIWLVTEVYDCQRLGIGLRQKLLMVLYSSYCECEAYNLISALSDDASHVSHVELLLHAPEIAGYFAASL